jgi:DNA-binding XRE family transcriptional regulator
MIKSITTTFTEFEMAAFIEGAIKKAIDSIPTVIKAEIINRNELCKRLDISEPTVIKWEKEGLIPSFSIGSSVRYNWHTVLEALQKKKGGTARC